ncbi:hypothetical protein FSP39_004191 [Pinctada imbricata]|uniref:CCHC-type domain-containing protein n=1 Tax=Pinctada imbricata TaxID=66713 RepID=A0AA89BYM8_PINIB|nr:hypothetical protein FSP39_004191 [Pinctada imbricata]
MDDTLTATPATVINMDESPMFIRRQGPTYQRQPSAISDKISIDKFSGFSTENGQNFLREFESFCTFQNLSDDGRKIAAFHLHLKGPALVWFNALSQTDKIRWTSLKQAFTHQYARQDMFDPCMVAESALFESLKLNSCQPLEQFHSEIMEKGMKLQKPERDMITKFINELPTQLAFFVRAASVQSFKEALKQAKLGEAYGYRTTTETTAAVRHQQVPSSTENQMFSMMKDISERLSKLETGTGKRHEQQHPGGGRNTIQCHICSGEGHKKSQCQWTGRGDKNPRARCQFCEQNGHFAKQCRLFEKAKEAGKN